MLRRFRLEEPETVGEASELLGRYGENAKVYAGGTELLLAMKEGLVPSIYCHAVGYHGHAAGPPIGMTDYQEGVPVRGDYVFRASTWHSIELNATHKVPEWGGQVVKSAQEEDAIVGADGTMRWALRRQTTFHLVTP